MAFNMRSRGDDVDRYLEQEREREGFERGGRSQLNPSAAPARGRSSLGMPDMGASFGRGQQSAGMSDFTPGAGNREGNNPRGAAPAGYGGEAPPSYGSNPVPRAGATAAAPGSAMGLQPRQDPFGRAAPVIGARLAQQPAAGGAAAGGAAAAPAAAAGGGAGAGAAIAPFLSVLSDYQQRQQQANAVRQNAREGIQQSYVKSLGYPGYGVQAARALRDAEETDGGPEDYLKYAIPFGTFFG